VSNPTIVGRRIKLKNRRVWMGRDAEGNWCIQLKRLGDKQICLTNIRLSPEAMEAVVDLYFVIRDSRGPAA
jgi:hypothetical protein